MPAAVAPLLLVLLGAPPKAAPAPAGSVTGLEVTSVTRTHAYAFLRTRLPAAAKGARQEWRGDLVAWGVPIPVKQPVQAMVQAAGSAAEVVFLLEVAFAAVPADVMAKASLSRLELSLAGTLRGEGGSAAKVRASGTLPVGPPTVTGPPGLGAVFAKLASGKLSGLSLSQTRGEVRVALLNPFSFDIPVRELRYEAASGSGTLASGARRGLLIHRGRESTVSLPIQAANAELLSAALRAARAGGTLDLRLGGAVVIRVGHGEDAVLPFSVSGKVEVLP